MSASQAAVVEREEKVAKSRLLLAKLSKQAEDAKRRMTDLTHSEQRRQRTLHTRTTALHSTWSTVSALQHWQRAQTAQQLQLPATAAAAAEGSEGARQSGSEGEAGGAKKEGEVLSGGVSGIGVGSGGVDGGAGGVVGVDVDDEELDVDRCRPLLRVHLSDGRCWLLLAAEHSRTAAEQLTPRPTFATRKRSRHGSEEERTTHSQADTEGEEDEDEEAMLSAERVAASTAASCAGGVEGEPSTFLFFTLQSTFLQHKWRRYTASAREEGQQQQHQQRTAAASTTGSLRPFATPLAHDDNSARIDAEHARTHSAHSGEDGLASDGQQSSTSSLSSSSSPSTTSAPSTSSPPLSSYSTLFASPHPVRLFDSTVLPCDALWLCAERWRVRCERLQSRASSAFQSSLRSLQSELSLKEAEHAALVRDFSRYQHRTREALQQQQRQVDALTERQEEVDGLRAAALQLEQQLQRMTQEAATRSHQLTALAQQVALLNHEKQVGLEREERLQRLLLAVQEEARQRMRGQEEAEQRSAQQLSQHQEEEQRWKQREAQLQAALQQQRHAQQHEQPQLDLAPRHQHRSASSPTAAPATTSPHGGSTWRPDEDQAEGEREGGVLRREGEARPLGMAELAPAPTLLAAAASELELAAQLPPSPTQSPSLSSTSSSSSSSVSALLLEGASGLLDGVGAGGAGGGGVESALRVRLRALQRVVQERELVVVSQQALLDEGRVRVQALQAELRTLQSLQSAESLEYLKNVMTRFMASDDDSLVPVLCTLMGVDAQQQKAIAQQRHTTSRSRKQAATDRQRSTATGGGGGSSGSGSGGGESSGGSSAHFLASFYQ